QKPAVWTHMQVLRGRPYMYVAAPLAALLSAIFAVRAATTQPVTQPATQPSSDLTLKSMAVLRENCLSCHNPEKKKGGLVLTSRAAALKGGENGTILTPGDSAHSPLAAALLADADPHMPPKGQVSADPITL